MRQHTYYEAYLDDYDKIIVYMSRNSYDGQSNIFFLRDQNGCIAELPILSREQTANNYNKYTLHCRQELKIGHEYAIQHQHGRITPLEYGYIVKSDRFDEEFYYDGDDLGFTYTTERTAFALWAPTAYRVKLELQHHDQVHTYEMIRDAHGVFRYALFDDLENATYVYLIRVHGEWKQTCDPYGIASISNTRRSAVIDPKKIKMKDYAMRMMKSSCDAIIYEASIRDFTMQHHEGTHHAGKYLGFVEENKATKKHMTGFSYLKSLGITHVQLMPVLDFGSVDEELPSLHYNWGYDPVQYRCLEGSYATDPNNPYSRIFEFCKVVESCHANGIRVVLDVVFNHVYDMETSSFQICVPNYYFQMNAEGSFSNGTFCGNDFDSTRRMSRKYLIDTCCFLVKTYHIDGFRFDLMGILDQTTMNEIYQRCAAIQPNFMIYGEGWDMPSMLSWEQRASIQNNWKMPEIAHFSDRFRDVVKGNTSASEVNVKGYCSGAVYLMEIMKNCMIASAAEYGGSRMFAHPKNVVNYVECHDNMTSWDKLRECCKEDTREVRIHRQEMMIAAVLLAQGIPFLHSGQEFARTKHGLSNTYEESDEINKIDYHRRDRYEEIVRCTRALIRIRKAYRCLRFARAEDVIKHVEFDDIDQKVLIYKAKKDDQEIIAIFNPTQEHFHYPLPKKYELLYYNGEVLNEAYQDVEIDRYATIIMSSSRLV